MKYLALAWALAALLLFSDARNVRDFLARTSALGLRGEAQAATPLAQTYPEFAADAQTWVRHALSLAEGDSLRLRHTTIDNAPEGRDVHWNSGWAWAIAAAGGVQRLATPMPYPRAVEKATLWLTPLALLAAIVAFSSWALRYLGVRSALFLVAAMALHERILEGFHPGYVDHHGLLGVAVLGTALGAVAMVRGVRAGAAFSALCGAFGLWVSAASLVPAIAATALAGAFVSAWHPGDARAWRLWGAIGAGASLAFYLAEYFPQHMGLRLEANHPMYAVAWLAGGEVVARLAEDVRRPPLEMAWPWLALLAVPVAIAFGGANVLAFTDPFMARLHGHYIREFVPMWTTLSQASPGTALRMGVLEAAPLAAALATLAVMRGRSPAMLLFATFVAATLLAMAWWQARWLINSSAAQVVLALVLVDTWTAGRSGARRWSVAAAVAAVLLLPGAIHRYGGAIDRHEASLRDAGFPLARDIARALRDSQPQGEIVLLASPDASTAVGYYGRFKTLGTLYWENAPGLKAAAAMFSARDDDEARRLLRERGVTHVAMISEGNFVAPYYDLLHPGATASEIEASFGWRLLAGAPAPAWLEPIPYEVPADLADLEARVLLFKVR